MKNTSNLGGNVCKQAPEAAGLANFLFQISSAESPPRGEEPLSTGILVYELLRFTWYLSFENALSVPILNTLSVLFLTANCIFQLQPGKLTIPQLPTPDIILDFLFF